MSSCRQGTCHPILNMESKKKTRFDTDINSMTLSSTCFFQSRTKIAKKSIRLLSMQLVCTTLIPALPDRPFHNFRASINDFFLVQKCQSKDVEALCEMPGRVRCLNIKANEEGEKLDKVDNETFRYLIRVRTYSENLNYSFQPSVSTK